MFAVDPLTGGMIVGSYSGDDGSYIVPGLAAGDYLVAIEPLDGEPVGLDPSRINQVVQFTFDTNFPEEFYDANESNVEADPAAGNTVNVVAGAATPAIDLITNTVQVPGVNVVFEEGYNLFAYPVGGTGRPGSDRPAAGDRGRDRDQLPPAIRRGVGHVPAGLLGRWGSSRRRLPDRTRRGLRRLHGPAEGRLVLRHQ